MNINNMYVLTIDIGNETFGYCIIQVEKIISKPDITGLVSANAISMKLLKFASDNVVGDIDITYKTTRTRTLLLKKYLNSITAILDELKIDLIQVQATWKNKIHFLQNLAHSMYIAKYKTTKTAAKRHTIENFNYWIKSNGITSNISKKMISHAADAFMQFYSYYIHNITL